MTVSGDNTVATVTAVQLICDSNLIVIFQLVISNRFVLEINHVIGRFYFEVLSDWTEWISLQQTDGSDVNI